MKKYILAISLISLTLGCFSPSQDQVDKAVQKEFQRRDEEKKKIFGYIDEYMKERGEGALNDRTGEGSRPLTVEEQLKNPKKIEIGESPIKGFKNAKVTIVEFSDFQCSFCSRVNPVLDSLLKKYAGRIRLVYKFFPLPIHPDAKIAAQAAVAAQKQGKFWEMHDKLFLHQTELKPDQLKTYADELNLEPKKFEKDMNDSRTIQRIDSETKQALSVGFKGTPSFLINGVPLVGSLPEEEFSKIIDTILKN